MYKLVRRSFKELPLVHVIGREVCVLHGGLPLDPFITLHDIDAIDRRRGVPVFHCSLLGYPRFQRVKAKRDLRTDDGEQVLAGSMGKLIDRVGKSHKAFVRFSSAHGNDEVEVVIWGSPELEEDVEIYYETDDERKRHRSNRLFVSLLWSDPIHSKKDLGPSKRGAGCCFDERITNEFLKTNKLTMLLRSHEKRDSGYSEEHRSKDGKALSAATIFSASNYPSGAGEPKGNKGAVILLKASNDGTPLSQNFSFSKSWRKCYDDQSFNTIHLSNELREKFLRAEEQNKRSVSARARALAKLRELTYCARPKLLAYWQKADKDGTGVIEMKHWSSGLRACVIPDDDFPWEWLCSYMLKTYSENATDYNYASYLAQYENSLSRKLADRWHGGAVLQICQGVLTTKDAEKAWARIDKNGDGRLSYQELKPLLKSRLSSDVQSDEDRVYSVMSKMDKNRSGYVDRHEFIEAVSRCLGGRSILEEANDGQLSARGKRSLLLQQELDQWGEQEVSQCWAAAQGAIRALSATTGCASSVFEVLDEDDDGVIDRSEFQQGLHQLLRGSPLLKCIDKWEPLLWKLVDEDGSGYVSPEELNLAFSVREVLSI
ncbi:unnamed protein product [Polarella glacialis]|uniref:EF-hand domain-containing protein n=2 Tax=Polarella glacialis TaxID=89957 RepID=A0A813DVC0_POLGL|nr:unnamed protein product [Polarella glacialis]